MVAINQETLLGELIPDVYIRKITLETSGTPLTESNPHIDSDREELPRRSEDDADALVVTLELLMKEKLDNDLIGTWFANQDLDRYLDIKVFQSTDSRTTALLSAGSDLLDLVDPGKTVPTEDLRMRLAATVFGVRSAQEVMERIDRKVSFRKIAASKQGTGVTPRITQYKESVDDDGNRVFDISFTQRFELKGANPEHLAYFAMTSLNLEELARDFELDFDAIGLRAMNGKIASDLVIDDFNIVNQSYTFLDPEGRVWTGSVHRMPNGQFRSGAMETENSVNLERFPVSNTKLQDFRDVKEIERLMLDFRTVENSFLNLNPTKIFGGGDVDSERNPVYFSDMYLSRDKDGDAKFLFSVDFDKLIQDNAVFGRLFANSNERLKMQMLRNTQIRSMRVLRRRIKENTSLNKLGSPVGIDVFDRDEALDLVAASSEKSWKRFASTRFSAGTLREVELVMEEESPMVRHFTGMDLTMSELTDGLYQYVVEMEVDDATVEFLETKIQTLQKAKAEMERYLAEASKLSVSKYLDEIRDPHIEHPSEFAGTQGENAGAFDIASNRFTQNFIDKQRERFSGRRLRFAPWIAPIAVYADTLDLFTDAFRSRRDRQRLLKSLYSYASPNTGNPNGINTVIKLMEVLITSLAKVTGVTLTTSPRRFDGTSTSTLQSPILNVGRSSRRTFKVVKEFNEIFDSDVVKGVGVDYLSKGEDETDNDDGLRVIRNRDFQDRVNLETLKYFKAPEPNIDMSFGGQQFTERDSIKTTNFSYLSPSRIDFSQRSIVLSEGEKTVNSSANLEPGEDGKRIPDSGRRKNKKKRFLEHIDNGEVNREDLANEIYSSILFVNSLSSPGETIINRSIGESVGKGNRANRGKKKLDKNKINEETIKRTFETFFADQASIVSRSVRVQVKKDPRDKFVVLTPVRPSVRSEISVDCPTPEDESDALVQSQEEEDFNSLTLENFPLNQFYLTLAQPLVQKGEANAQRLRNPRVLQKTNPMAARKRKIPSFISSLNLRELRVVSTSGRDNALRTIHGLNHVMTENQIKKLPNQLKALLLQTASQNVVRPAKFRGLVSRDTAEKRRADGSIALDFKMLQQVEYFAGFEKNEEGETLIRRPIWKLLTDERNNELIGKDILCRTVPYENRMLGVLPDKGMQTAVYDEYFVLRPKFKEEQLDASAPASIIRNEISRSIIADLELNFPGIEVSRVELPPPVITVNEGEEDDNRRTPPSDLVVVERFPDGRTEETKLEVRDREKPRRGNRRRRRDDTQVNLGERGDQINVNMNIAMELLATDSQSRNVEDEFITANVAIQVPLEREVDRIIENTNPLTLNTLLPFDEDEELGFIDRLADRVSIEFVESLDLTEQQAQILFNSIPASAITEAEAIRSIEPMLRNMNLVPEEPETVTVIRQVQVEAPETVQQTTVASVNVTNINEEPVPRTTVADLIRKSRR